MRGLYLCIIKLIIMKQLCNVLLCVFLISIVSCNTTSNELDNERTVVKSDFVSSAQLALAGIESNIKSSLKESQNFNDFRNNLKAKEEKSKLNFQSSVNLKSGYTVTKEDSLIRLALDEFKATIYNEFDANNVEGSRDEFLIFLDQKKQDFIEDVACMEFLDNQEKKDLLIAQMFYEIGVVELLIEYSDDISSLGQDSDSFNNLKSASSCNWWCMAKLYVKCDLLSKGAILCYSASATPASFLAWAAGTGLSWLAFECWVEYYNNIWGIFGL